MKKYEPAGGVVPLEWESGAPDPERHFGRYLLEVWRLEWSCHKMGEFTAYARLVVVDRVTMGGVGAFARGNGTKFTPGSDELVRRSCSLGRTATAYMNVTLEDWPR